MSRVPVKNPNPTNMFVGNVCIPPGETRTFEPSDLPPHLRRPAAPAKPAAPVDPVVALQEQSANKVKAGLEDLDDDQLQQLLDLEQARDRPRKSVVEAVEGLQMERLAQHEEARELLNGEPEAVIDGLEGQDPALLPVLRRAEAEGENREEVLTAIDAALVGGGGEQ